MEAAMHEFETVAGPAYGDPNLLAIELSAGPQLDIEDCQACCRPINVVVSLPPQGLPQVSVFAEDDTWPGCMIAR